MTWQERLRATIQLTSPLGSVFEASWAGNERTLEKKLGIFQFPKIKGSLVQDLDVAGKRYPLTIFFEGSDHDLESDRFFKACEENGVWAINHPVRGLLSLQLISVSENISPVESGNITEFATEWIEPLDKFSLPSLPELASRINSQVSQLNITSSEQFVRNVRQDKFKQVEKLTSAINNTIDAVTRTLRPLYQSSSEINARATSIIRGVQDTISSPIIDVAGLAGQIQNLIQIPLLAVDDVPARFSAYSELLSDVLSLTPDDPTEKAINTAMVQELSSTAAISSMAQVSVSGNLKTRQESIGAIENILSEFTTMTNSLDDSQEIFQQNDIDLQYFSQSASFSDSSVIVAQSVDYLLQNLFSLAIEKRFKIKTNRTPIDITISEYGTLGVEDENFDLFLESNKLQGNDILLLNSGTEVVVYV